MKKIINYLKKVDPVLGQVIDKDLKPLAPRGSVYEGLLRSIISQQISVAAANSVREKFLKNFGGKFPEPKVLANLKDEDLAGCGLSRQKITYVKNVGKHWLEESLDESKFQKMSNQEIIDDLSKIKGVGTWTVEMLLIFNLQRPDVFSVKDLGLVTPMYKLYKINPNKYKPKNLQKKLIKIAEKWSPYRSLACRYLWNFKDSKK
jgi:DNA-3-methyladenine glycosylase II